MPTNNASIIRVINPTHNPHFPLSIALLNHITFWAKNIGRLKCSDSFKFSLKCYDQPLCDCHWHSVFSICSHLILR